MIDPMLLHRHTGCLTVTIYSLDGSIERCNLSFKDTTLFDFIGEACARIFTNLTTQVAIRTRPENWKIIRFSPENCFLSAEQIDGEPLKIVLDDPERLSFLLQQ